LTHHECSLHCLASRAASWWIGAHRLLTMHSKWSIRRPGKSSHANAK
jgi:hypothetical protein